MINAKSHALARDEPIEDRLTRRDKEYKAHLDELRREKEKQELKAMKSNLTITKAAQSLHREGALFVPIVTPFRAHRNANSSLRRRRDSFK